MKILVDAETKKILGASLLGIECDEVIHSILDVMYANAPYTVIQPVYLARAPAGSHSVKRQVLLDDLENRPLAVARCGAGE